MHAPARLGPGIGQDARVGHELCRTIFDNSNAAYRILFIEPFNICRIIFL